MLATFATRSTINRTVWLFDSFQGMPNVTEHDEARPRTGDTAQSHIGKEVGDIEHVKEVLKLAVHADMRRIRIVPDGFRIHFRVSKIERIALLKY